MLKNELELAKGREGKRKRAFMGSDSPSVERRNCMVHLSVTGISERDGAGEGDREKVRACAIPCGDGKPLAGVSNPRPTGRMHLRLAMNVTQHKIVHLLKTF